MNRLLTSLTVALALGAATNAAAASAGVDALASSDSDGTRVSKVGVNLDWRYAGPQSYQGLRLETVHLRPRGQKASDDRRAYYRFAGEGAQWDWNGEAGTNGHTLLGGFNVHNDSKYRQEYFVERDMVETPQGVSRGLYYTMAGAALDVPLGDRDTITGLAAVQDFSGKNIRTHLRAAYIHELKPDRGLTAQLRTRYFHDSTPNEFDYFSPRDFVQVLPTLQVRNHLGQWRYQVAAGLGAQKQTGEGWRQARAFSASLTSPPIHKTWSVKAAIAYSNTPTDAGYAYDYRQVSIALRRSF